MTVWWVRFDIGKQEIFAVLGDGEREGGVNVQGRRAVVLRKAGRAVKVEKREKLALVIRRSVCWAHAHNVVAKLE